MKITLYYCMSDDRQINKEISRPLEITGELRQETSISSPVIRVYSNEILRYNYCYIEDFHRYYYISSIDAVSNEIYDVALSVDVLMSFRGDITQLYCIVSKQTDSENGDEYIDDSSLVTDNVMFSKVYTFPNGFLDSPEYILITAG